VGISLVLICAAFGQAATWVVNIRLLAASAENLGGIAPSPLIASPVLYKGLYQAIDYLNHSALPTPRILFSVCLLLSMLSAIGWYAVARLFLGRAWGLWAGILWGVNPLIAFLAQRPGPLALSIVTVPFAWALILAWSRSRRRRTAFVGGLAAGLATLASAPMLLGFAFSAPLLLAVTRRRRKAWQGFALLWLGLALPLVTLVLLVRSGAVENPLPAFADHFLASLDEGDGSAISRAMRNPIPPNEPTGPVRLRAIAHEVAHSPAELPVWLLRRMWRTIYATSDGHFQRPLFAVQLALLVPAIWGAVVCLRQPRWRGRALASMALIAAFWLVAAIAAPFARSLSPIGGMVTIFALVAIADLYERAFGRRLSASASGLV
jgi:hypothetical protein